MSQGLQVVLSKLQEDWNFIGEFLKNPEEILKSYNLDEEEYQALSTNNSEALMALGNTELVGAHTTASSMCPPITTVTS